MKEFKTIANNDLKEKTAKKIVLGRGLGALLPGIDTKKEETYKIFDIEIEKIKTGAYQPRIYFDEEKLNELKNSIKEHGIIQPLIVAKSAEIKPQDKNVQISGQQTPEGTYFQAEASLMYDLIAGERRYRAAKELNLKVVPVIVKDFSGGKALEIALIENIQRQDLNAIEEAICYKKLIDEYHLTHEALSKRIGKDRATITNLIRLLSLSDEVKKELISGSISPSHARSMVGLSGDETNMLLGKITSEKLTVRDTESAVQGLKKTKKHHSNQVNNKEFPEYSQIKKYENELFEKFQTKLTINYKNVNNKLAGKIEFSFFSSEELERIVNLLNS